MTNATFEYVAALVRRRAAIVLEPGKEYLVEARLLPLVKQEQLAGIDELADRVRAAERSTLATQVIEAMTTNETSFFRDLHPFEALRKQLLPEMMKARAVTRTIRLWCAAASTGQEPYSIAMTILEHFPELAGWTVQITATDINTTVIDRAQRGIYKQIEVNRGLPAPLLLKYFDRVGTEWQIKPVLRNMVAFQELNLLDRWPLFAPPDIVFMRNVLIYFDVPTKKRILERVRQTMRSDGVLVLGGGETTLNIDDQLEAVRGGTSSVLFRPKAGAPVALTGTAASPR